MKQILLLIISSLWVVVSPQPTDKMLLVDKLKYDFFKIESGLWKQITNGGFATKEKQPEVALIQHFEMFGDDLHEDYPHNISRGLNSLEGNWGWASIYAEQRIIDTIYEAFRRFQRLQTADGRIPSPPQAWDQLTDSILTYSNSVPQVLQKINDFIIQEKLYSKILKEEEGGMICNLQQSPQQILMNLYSSIAITELKGYSMVQYAYMLLTIHGKGNYTEESKLMHKRYEERSMMSIKALQKAMEASSRDMWRCDPRKHVKGVTYEEITELLQGYLQNEVDLNQDGTCGETCADYSYTKSHGCFKNLWCKQQRNCEGKIINCRFYDSDMWVCPADPKTNRRYEYIEYENGKVLGRKQGCARGLTSVDSWWRWLFWHCSYCMCLCDDPGRNSDRYFNLKPYMADIKNNRVVTGLRFKKLNRIIHLQIQEGKLMPKGVIDPETVHWVPLHDYKLTDRHIYNKQDYHTLSWENRAIDMDDLIVDDGHVVTGIRFKLIGSHINFEVFITPFNFATGELIDPELRTFPKDNPNTDVSNQNKRPRRRLNLDNMDVPTHSLNPSIPDSKSDMYLEFVNTGFDVDIAQTTVPFIDTQDVESLIPVPLSGVGIYHKGRKGFGGFIAPKIITYDYSKHLEVRFNENKYVSKDTNEGENDLVDFVPAN